MAFNYSPKTVTDGLVLYMDAANSKSYVSGSTTWNDISRGGNIGTLVNGPTFNAANGGSIVLDGTNDYVFVSHSVNLEPTSITMQCAFYMGTWNNYPGLMSKGYWDSSTTPKDIAGYGMHIRPNYDLWVDFNNSGSRVYLNAGVNAGITQNSFNFITVTIGSMGANIYNKEINYYSDNTNYTIAYTGNNGGVVPADLWIGWMQYQGGTLDGKIYNASIYNRALSQQEITQNYNATKTRFGLT